MANALAARNPILVAEDLAMLGHFTGGGMFVGFERGYRSRHVTTIRPEVRRAATAPTEPDYAEHDRVNRALVFTPIAVPIIACPGAYRAEALNRRRSDIRARRAWSRTATASRWTEATLT